MFRLKAEIKRAALYFTGSENYALILFGSAASLGYRQIKEEETMVKMTQTNSK